MVFCNQVVESLNDFLYLQKITSLEGTISELKENLRYQTFLIFFNVLKKMIVTWKKRLIVVLFFHEKLIVFALKLLETNVWFANVFRNAEVLSDFYVKSNEKCERKAFESESKLKSRIKVLTRENAHLEREVLDLEKRNRHKTFYFIK